MQTEKTNRDFIKMMAGELSGKNRVWRKDSTALPPDRPMPADVFRSLLVLIDYVEIDEHKDFEFRKATGEDDTPGHIYEDIKILIDWIENFNQRQTS